MKLYYTYIITNLINGKQYVGDHSTDNIKKDNYLGSGVLLKEDQKKYGKNNFEKIILENFESKETAYKAQEKYIRFYKTHVSQGGYNKNWTGGQWPSTHSEETKRKISLSNLGRKSPRKGKNLPKEHIKNISLSLLGEKNPNHKSKLTEERKQFLLKNLIHDKSGENNGMYGKKHKEESKEKNRLAHIGKKVNGKLSGQSRLGKKRGKYKTKKIIYHEA